MKDSYRVKMNMQYSYFSHLCDADAAMKAYGRPCKLEIKLSGVWA